MNVLGRSYAVRQRGAFALLATLLLLVVVAVAIRLLLGSSQATTYGTSLAGQSVQAYLLGVSGQERAVAILKSVIPNVTGKLDAAECSTSKFGSDPFDLGNGTFQFTGLTPTPATPTPCINDCTGCDVQVTGKVGSASRVLNLSVAYSSTPGVTGFGTTVTQRLKTSVVPSAAIFNLAYRRQMSNLGGGQATVTECAGCEKQWDIESSSGNPSVGGYAVYDPGVGTPGTYTVTQTLNVARNYAEVGFLLEGTGGGFGRVGSYADDKGGIGKKTTGTSNTVTGEVTNGAATDNAWCRGGAGSLGPPFADTLVFGFSGRSTTTADMLSAVTFNCEEPGNPAKCKNPISFRLDLRQRQESYAGDMYSEIWVLTNPDHTSVVGSDTSAGETSIPVTKIVGSDNPVAGSLVSIRGAGAFSPGTRVVSFVASTLTISPPGLSKAAKKGDVICGGTCALFDHTTNGNTAFNITKSAGTTQWAAGFMCLKGVKNVIPIFQGNARPALWYEPF